MPNYTQYISSMIKDMIHTLIFVEIYPRLVAAVKYKCNSYDFLPKSIEPIHSYHPQNN